MELDYIRLSRVSVRMAAQVRFPHLSGMWITSEQIKAFCVFSTDRKQTTYALFLESASSIAEVTRWPTSPLIRRACVLSPQARKDSRMLQGDDPKALPLTQVRIVGGWFLTSSKWNSRCAWILQ